jgi:isoflavone 7-O-glucosyltransferase
MPLQIPGLPKSLSTDDYPDGFKDSIYENKALQDMLDSMKTTRECDGIIVNTFDGIEGRAIKALNEGLFIPNGIPPIFCTGPLIASSYGEDENGCLSWLDSQPIQSVVLLSFGSMGRFSKAQLNEIALGLEKSEQRFLWVVRTELDLEEQSLDKLLPEGFLERTKERGMVVRNWAPQGAILKHDSIGGFVTHCGWNSVLEAVCEGVPMVALPLYAEQRLNKVILVEEMKVALELKDSKDGFVSGTELGDRIKELMDSDKGKEIRQIIFKMKISAKEAREEGGSSLIALNKLAQLWKQK